MTPEEKERRQKKLKRWHKKSIVAKYEMNTQDTDWLAANRLKEVVNAGGIGAKAAQDKLDEWENSPQVRPKGMK